MIEIILILWDENTYIYLLIEWSDSNIVVNLVFHSSNYIIIIFHYHKENCNWYEAKQRKEETIDLKISPSKVTSSVSTSIISVSKSTRKHFYKKKSIKNKINMAKKLELKKTNFWREKTRNLVLCIPPKKRPPSRPPPTARPVLIPL